MLEYPCEVLSRAAINATNVTNHTWGVNQNGCIYFPDATIQCTASAVGITDTNASTECAGTTTYLDGEGNCDDISSVYVQASDWTTIDNYPSACSAGQYVHTIADTLTC